MTTTFKLYSALALCALLAASHWYAYSSGNSNGQNAVKVAVLEKNAIALNERLDANKLDLEQRAAAAKEASESHEKELKAVRDNAARDIGKRVPISANICRTAGASEIPAPGGYEQEPAGTFFLQQAFADDLRQLAASADETLANLRYLVKAADKAGCFQ